MGRRLRLSRLRTAWPSAVLTMTAATAAIASIGWAAAAGATLSATSSLTSPETPGSGAGAVISELLCDGDCSNLPATPALSDGSNFDFEYGIRPLVDGFDLTLTSKGNIFLLGPLRTGDSLGIVAGDSIHVGPDVRIVADRIELFGDIPFPELPVAFPPLYPIGGERDRLICGCITLRDLSGAEIPITVVSGGDVGIRDGGRLELFGDGQIRLVESRFEAVTSVVQQQIVPGLTISRDGDLFVDLSLVTLKSLRVTAGKSVVIVTRASLPVPEPGTALLLGLGLAALASARGDVRAV